MNKQQNYIRKLNSAHLSNSKNEQDSYELKLTKSSRKLNEGKMITKRLNDQY